MTKPKTIHTLESLSALTIEEGDCRLWGKYLGNGVPMIYHDGKLMPVRKLILALHGIHVWAKYAGINCGNPLCVEFGHIVQRSPKQNSIYMGKMLAQSASNKTRIQKMTASRRNTWSKLTQAQAVEIRMSDESGPVLAERFGVSRSMVNRIKRGESWAHEFGNPFAGLFTGLAANDSGRKRA